MKHQSGSSLEMAKKGQKKLETDPAKFETNEKLMVAVGLLRSKTWLGITSLVVTEITMGLAFLHYAAKIVLGEENDILDIMKSMHLSLAYIVALMSGISMITMSKYFYKCSEIISAGFTVYESPFSSRFIHRRAILNRKIIKMGKNVLLATGFLIGCSILKEPSPTDFKKWRKLYAGWFPFRVDNYTKYVISQIFHVLIAINVVCWSSSFMVSFITFAEHTICEIKIIGDFILESFDAHKNAEKDPKSEMVLLVKIKDVVKHHNELLRFFKNFRAYFYIHILTVITGTTVLLCTSTYVITAPESTMKDVIGFFAMLLPEFCVSASYCYYGQLLTTYSENLRDIIYSTLWYDQTKKVKFAVHMMLVKTRKPLKLSAGGLSDASLASLKEMVQTSFTFFNMIRAVK